MSTMYISLQAENRQLKLEVTRLTEQLEQRNNLISSLECQIRALLAGQARPNPNARPDSGNTFRHPEADHSTPRQPASGSLMPPRRSTVEMEYPLAPKEEEEKKEASPIARKQVKMVSAIKEETESDGDCSPGSKKDPEPGDGPSPRPLLKGGLKSSRGTIRALPREISIANCDDDEVTKCSLGECGIIHKITKTEIRDAYGARGTYTGAVSPKEKIPHGKGTMEYHQASKSYEGDWHMGHWHGKGTIRDSQGVYTGEIANDLKEGQGEMVYSGGRRFNGIFRQDEPAEGTMTYTDKREYKGELRKGVWHGVGTLSYPDGSKYTGEFHNGVQHGKGIFNFSDGSVYEGDTVMGAYEGKGKMTWSDGGWYEGEWKNSEANGYGMEIRPDGRLRHHGEWRKGVPVRG